MPPNRWNTAGDHRIGCDVRLALGGIMLVDTVNSIYGPAVAPRGCG